jgi:hypothetical protein
MRQIITILLILVSFSAQNQSAEHENKYCKQRGHVWTAIETTRSTVAPPSYIEDNDSVSYMVYPSGVSYRKTCLRCKTDSIWRKEPVKKIIWKQEQQ